MTLKLALKCSRPTFTMDLSSIQDEKCRITRAFGLVGMQHNDNDMISFCFSYTDCLAVLYLSISIIITVQLQQL